MDQPDTNIGQPLSPATEQFNQPQPTEPKKFNWLFVIIVAAVALLATAAIFYFIGTGQLGPETNLNISPVPTTNEFAGWQTYKNEQYGFEVKYPENTLTEVSVEEGLPPDYSSKFSGVKLISSARADNLGKKECMYGGSGLISICKAESEGGITFIPIDKQFQDIVKPITNTETISILGKEGIGYFIGAEGEGIDYYIIPLTSTHALIIARTYRIDGFMSKQLFNQILSTFKFTQ